MANILRVNYATTGRRIDAAGGVGVTGETGVGPATGLHDQGDLFWTASGAGVIVLVAGTNSAGSFLNRFVMLPISVTAGWISA